ncbi:hypothetical protein HS088_TW14G00584 [Tripterygium wilfordii]|uniref:Uncharacterized protein n=1 Tax=Tripterygium wilfordii TaxID=458696 RepID=A0A7J7CQQ9_TRIWF|nr:uncharacterized protein LOC120015472 [Tripterygium wilfordii]KAF5736442.1 hypothetical protein HS088_TW14G00584 [Tripterygium wilfordii]
MKEKDVDHSWNSETSWIVVGGSLTSSVTFESSSIPVSDDDNDQAIVDWTSQSPPLILCPPLTDPNPCEITIIFAKKHEVGQVYVRSTARVYEIYYTPEVGSSSEYLCTVHCGITARDDQVLQTTDTEGTVVTNVKGVCKEADSKKMKIDTNLSTNEDDWVEVKVPSTSLIDNGSNFLPSNIATNPGKISQDYYEATAEITDANPCMSLTVRLLSLQNKGFICVDEVYVFADLADPADVESQTGSLDNSAGSSLMALLVPTFLQLSKSTGVGQQEKRDTFGTWERQIPEEIGSKAINAMNALSKVSHKESPDVVDHQTMKFPDMNSAGPTNSVKTPQVSDAESRPDVPDRRAEEVLEHLVSRVSRVEDLLLRFEENMLKPINNIEVRLLRVEQQLELLYKKTQSSGVQNCTRFAAPDFSCCESDHNSFYIDGSDHLKTCELGRKDLASNALPGSPDDDQACSVNTAQLHPCFVVTAPEFSSDDCDEENDAVDLVMGSTKIKSKHAMSIDDNLAALDGLSSLTSMHLQKYLQTPEIKAPEFPNEEGKNDTKAASPRVHSEMRTDPLIEGTECIKTSVSSICNTLSLEAEENGKGTHHGDNFERIHEGFNRQCHRSDREEGAFHGITVDYTAALPPQNENCDAKDIMKSGEVGYKRSSHGDDNFEKTHGEVDGQCRQNGRGYVPFHAKTFDYAVASSTRNDTCDAEDGVKTGVVGHRLSSHGNDNLENGDRGFDILCHHNYREAPCLATPVDSAVTFMPHSESCDMKEGTKTGEVGHETGSHGDDNFEGTHGVFDRKYQLNDKEDVPFHATTIDCVVSSMHRNEMCDMRDGIETGEVSHNNNSVLKADSLGQFTGNWIDADSDITHEAAVVRPAFADTTHKVSEEGSNEHVLQDVLEFPRPTSSLNFELPILDVRFISEEHGNNKSSLEALLAVSLGLQVQSPSIVEIFDGPQIADKGDDLISLDDVDQSIPIAGGELAAVDMDYCTLTGMHVKVEDARPKDYNGRSNLDRETYAASLI